MQVLAQEAVSCFALSQTTFFYSSKLKEFSGDNFKFDEYGCKFFQKGEKHCGKRRNCSLRAISSFPIVFSKDLYSRHIKQGFTWERG